jgi:hypothetical protein
MNVFDACLSLVIFSDVWELDHVSRAIARLLVLIKAHVDVV